MINRLTAFALSAAAACGLAPAAGAADWASVILYQGFDEGDSRSTRIDQFEAHIAELTTGGYTVLPLDQVVAALKERRPLPDRTVAITIDTVRRSVLTLAWPRLERAGLPATLFVATEPLDRGEHGALSWPELRALVRAGAGIGSQTASAPHMARQRPARNAEEINLAGRRLRDELGITPTLFAYPFGEWTAAVRRQVAQSGFAAAFGQQSGVANSSEDWYSLPRFVMSEAYGSIGRFRLAAGALPLKVGDVVPDDPLIGRNPPAIGFTVEPGTENLDQLACFASSQAAPATLERLGERRIELRLDRPLPPGRARINCTVPAAEGRWRWFGMQLLVP